MRTLLILFLLLLGTPLSAQELLLEDVIEDTAPSVVGIVAQEKEGTQALGAGIIISADGYVVTNAHVAEDAVKITVITSDEETLTARTVGLDRKTDIALLKINHPLNLEPAHFADSDLVRVGNRVFAVGNPFGLGNSVSQGIISAKERNIDKGPYDNFLQTDAAINQGNSGGPLFNMNGEVIGINTAIFSTDGQNMRLGFATPSNIVRWVVKQLKTNGRVVRGWLGISVQPTRITTTEGREEKLVVSAMAENSPAYDAGLQVGDILESAGEIALDNPRIFSLGIAQTEPGTVLPITVLRNNELLDLSVKVQKMPKNNLSPTPTPTTTDIKSLADLGIDKYQVKNAVYYPDLGIKAYFDEVNREMVIVAIDPQAEILSKGIQIGDRFNMANDTKIFSAEDLRIKIKMAKDNGKITLIFLKGGEVDTVTVNFNEE